MRAAVAMGLLALISACSEEPKRDPLAGLTIVREDASGAPLSDLSDHWRDRFNEGDALFDKPFLESDGLGPVFIRQACASCHGGDGRGPGAVRKMVIVDAQGNAAKDQSALPFGHTVRPQRAAGVSEAITVPEGRDDVLVTTRFPPAVFGRGYLEAIEDSEIERIADEQAMRDDAISGRVNYVEYRSQHNPDVRFHDHQPGETLIGRFGLKARIATLDDFTADALQGDMGITSPMRPDELPNPASPDDEAPGLDTDLEVVNHIADYMRMLRIPTRHPTTDSNEIGKELFADVGCDSCHVPTLHTQKHYSIAALADMDAPIYSDLLLHDMGEGFSDALEDFEASGSEWRTSPLMGLRHQRSFLHDGRAKSVEEAITLHGAKGGEARDVAQRFAGLKASERAALVEFVEAL